MVVKTTDCQIYQLKPEVPCVLNLGFRMGTSYADLWDQIAGRIITADDDFHDRLAALGTPIKQEQAQLLTDHWSIASHQPNTTSGFSATLFQSKDDTSKYVLTIRGTESLSLTDWATDVRVKGDAHKYISCCCRRLKGNAPSGTH